MTRQEIERDLCWIALVVCTVGVVAMAGWWGGVR